jgi:hypothetical protein
VREGTSEEVRQGSDGYLLGKPAFCLVLTVFVLQKGLVHEGLADVSQQPLDKVLQAVVLELDRIKVTISRFLKRVRCQ